MHGNPPLAVHCLSTTPLHSNALKAFRKKIKELLNEILVQIYEKKSIFSQLMQMTPNLKSCEQNLMYRIANCLKWFDISSASRLYSLLTSIQIIVFSFLILDTLSYRNFVKKLLEFHKTVKVKIGFHIGNFLF